MSQAVGIKSHRRKGANRNHSKFAPSYPRSDISRSELSSVDCTFICCNKINSKQEQFTVCTKQYACSKKYKLKEIMAKSSICALIFQCFNSHNYYS